MSLTRAWLGVVMAMVAAPHLGAQSIADRVAAVREGTVQMTYASRPEACGDGRDITALGRLFMVYPSVQGHGWSRMDCTFGPARAVVTRRDGEVTLGGFEDLRGGVTSRRLRPVRFDAPSINPHVQALSLCSRFAESGPAELFRIVKPALL